jgi:signal transduction histidine kinase
VEQRTERVLWAGGTAVVWAGTTIMVPQFSSVEALYSPLVALGALFVSPWYGAGLCAASLVAMAALSQSFGAHVLLPALAVVAVSAVSIHASYRIQAEQEDFELMLSLVRQVSSRLESSEVLSAIVRTAREATGAKASSLRLLGADKKTMVVRAADGLSPGYMEMGPVDVRRSPIDRKVLEGEIVQIRHAATDPRVQYPHEAEEEGIASVLCVPLQRKDGVIGLIRVYCARPRYFGRRDIRMLTGLAAQAVIALRHAELHAATLTFMRKVAHELRAPLSAISSSLKVLLEGITGALTEKQTDMLRRADRRTTLLLDAVSDLLSLSRARLQKPVDAATEVRLPRLVEAVTSLMKAQADEAGLELALELDPGVPPVAGSPEDIEELICNLISNAIKYTPSGGRVVASVSAALDRAIVRVTDTGIGIPKDDLPKLFDEFHRCSNVRQSAIEGTGLGMAIVKTLADRHRAELRVESEEGQGTTVEVAFPTGQA